MKFLPQRLALLAPDARCERFPQDVRILSHLAQKSCGRRFQIVPSVAVLEVGIRIPARGASHDEIVELSVLEGEVLLDVRAARKQMAAHLLHVVHGLQYKALRKGCAR